MFLTAAEVGHELGIRKSRVYELAAGGLLPVVRLGRRVLFPRRGLEQLAQVAIERAVASALSPPQQHARPPAPHLSRQAAARHTREGRPGAV
jgi:excisionase family DNA binding protein